MAYVALLSGSPSHGSRLLGLTDFSRTYLESLGHEVQSVSVAELPAEDLLRANFNSSLIRQALAIIEEADAVIIAGPVYKAAYSGALKTLLDLIPQKGLKGKIVLPLFIGGSLAHLLSVDYALKPVVAALGGNHILGGVYAVDEWVGRLETGGFSLTHQLKQRLEGALSELRAELEARLLIWREPVVDSLS